MADTLREYTREGLLNIINAMPTAVAVVDSSRTITMANPAALAFSNAEKKTFLGKAGGQALGCVNRHQAPEGCGFGEDCLKCRLREAMETTLTTGEPRLLVTSTMVFDLKGERILRFSTFPLRLAGEMSALISIEDLTEARQHEETRLEKEKLAAVLETTGGICHELSQPLQVIMGYCELLEERNSLDQETAKAIAAIGNEVKKLALLAHDLTHITCYKTKPYLKSRIIDIKGSSGSKS